MDLQDVFHWLYVGGMALGAIYLASLGRNPRGVPKYEYFVATFIPIWSGLAYMSMSLPHGDLEQGKIAVAGQLTHFARYLDWIVTTPLLLLALSWTAMHYLPKKDWTLIGSLMATQVIVIATGLIADLSVIPWVRYLWYICGVVAFLVILWGIWGPLKSISQRQGSELGNLYNKVATYFTVLWICYPIVWIVGPSGFRLINQTFETALFCIIPFFSKVGFSVLDLHGLRSLHHSSAQTPADRTAENIIHFMGNIITLGKSQRLSSRRRAS